MNVEEEGLLPAEEKKEPGRFGDDVAADEAARFVWLDDARLLALLLLWRE